MKKITLLDIIITIIFLLLIISIIGYQFFYKSNSKNILLIETNKDKYFYYLDQDKTIEVQGANGITVIEIKNGKFRFVSSPCPGKDCIKMGWVSISNYPVICLPNKVSAYIKSKEEPKYDGITR